ncbi:TonB-dependent receptor, partial [bacterium]|nr:TonB-dependent receptor [bacterium]
AGAVNITTASARAGDEFEGQIMASAESFDGRVLEGFVGGGLTDTLGARLAVKYRETDGFADNVFLGTPEGSIEELSYRLSLNWQPTDNLNINFKFSQSDYERIGATTTGKVFLNAAERDQFVPNRSAFANTAYSIMDVFYPGYQEQTGREFEVFKDNGYGRSREDGIGIGINPDSSDNDLTNMVFNVDWQVGELTLTSVTGYSEYQYVDGADVDWLPLQFISRDDDQSFEQVSQEFRIASPGGEFFDYVAGVYFDQSELEFDRQVAIDTNFDGLFPEFLSIVTPGNPPPSVLPQNLLSALTGGAYNMNQVARNHNYQLDSDSLAVFAQGTFNFTDTLRLTVGLRYTEENKDVISTQFLSDQNSGLLNPSDSYFLHLIQANSFNAYAYDYKQERSTDALTPSFNLQWNVGDDSMLYVSFSQGFKSGGFTAADDGNPGDLTPTAFPCAPNPDFTVDLDACYDLSNPNDDFEFGDEEVDAFELGGKHTLLDGGMTLNWALFYTEYTDLQTAIFEGLGFVVKNAAGSEIYGLEVDALWQATDNLRLGANFAYLDASYSDFDDGPCTAIQLDANPNCSVEQGNPLSGEPALYASDYSASFFFDYIRPMGDMELFVGGEVNYRDAFQSAGDNDPIDVIDSFTKANLRVGLRSGDWEIMAYGRNIFDEEVYMQSYDTPVLAGSHSRYMEESAVWGARLKYSF